MGLSDILELDPAKLENCQPILPDMAATASHQVSLDKNVVVIHHDCLPPGHHLRFRTPRYHAIYALHSCPQLVATIGLHRYSHGGEPENADQSFTSLVPAGAIHQADWSHPLNVTCLFLHYDFVDQLAQDLGLGPDLGLMAQFATPDSTLYHLVSSFRLELLKSSPDQAGPMYQRSLATSLGLQLVKKYSVCSPQVLQRQGALPSSHLNLVLEYVVTHLEGDLSLEHLAGLMGLQQTELLQTFEKDMGIPLQDYIQQKRIQRLDRLVQRLKLDAFNASTRTQLPGAVGAAENSKINHGSDRVIPWLNQLLLAQTGRSLNDTQTRIVVGILQGERYSEIARRHNQSEGHLKGVASDLWKLLSEVCGEPIRKPNLWSYLRRQGLLQD